MDQSQVFESSQHAVPSPCGTYLASLTQHNLYIQFSVSLAPAFTFPLASQPNTSALQKPSTAPQTIQWSAQSSRIILLSANDVHVFSIANVESGVHVSNGSGSLGTIVAVDVLAGDAEDQLMVVWEFGRVDVWDLATGRAVELGDIKSDVRGHAWSVRRKARGPEVLVLLRRTAAQDVLNFYFAPFQAPFRVVALPTIDAQALSWSACGKWVGVLDSPLAEQQLHVYTAEGFPYRRFPPKQNGDMAGIALGYKSLAWSNKHLVLAEDKTLVLLSTKTFSLDYRLPLSTLQDVASSLKNNTFFFQETINAAGLRSFNILTGPAISVPKPKTSIIDLRFSNCGAYLSCRDETDPTTLYIINPTARRVQAAVVLHGPLRKVAWHPTAANLLLLLSDADVLHLWDVDSGAAPAQLAHALSRPGGVPARIDARWADPKSGPTSEAVLVSTRKAGYQMLWPHGRPAGGGPGTPVRASDAADDDGGDGSRDSLFDILTGRTPLPELRVQRIEAEAAVERTERLDDTFREKVRARRPADTAAAAGLGGSIDDSDIF